MTARTLRTTHLVRVFSCAAPLFVLSLTLASTPAQAQGSGLDYLNKANMDAARSPEEAAAKHFNSGERHAHKAKKAQEKAGGGSELVAKARTEYERAAAELAKALGKDPTLLDARLLIGQVYAQLGEHEKSLSACHQAWAMDPKRYPAAVCEAQASLRLDRPRGAQEVYLHLKPKDPASANEVLAALTQWTESHADHSSSAALKTWLAAQSSAS